MDVIELNADRNILFVGKDTRVLKALQHLSGKDFQLIVAATAEEGLTISSTTSIQVIIVDQKLGEKSYESVLTTIKKNYPLIVRVFVIDENDPTQLISIINKVQVHRFISPTVSHEELSTHIQEAFSQFDIAVSHNLRINDLHAANKMLEEEVISITQELKKANYELQNAIEDNQNNLSFIEAVYNSVPGLLYLFDSKGKLVRWNKKFETILGYTPEDLINRDIIDLFNNDDSKEAIRLAIKTVDIDGFVDVEANIFLKDHSYIPMHFTAVPVHIGGVPYFTGIGVDISQLKKVEKKLKLNYALIEVAGETAKFGGWSYKIKDEKFEWSDSVRKILELPEGSIFNFTEIKQSMTPESRHIFLKAFDLCLKDTIPFDLELQIVTAKDRKIWVRVTGRAVKNKQEQVSMVQGSLQDINDSKIINIALNESERKISTLISNLPGFAYRSANDKQWTMFYISGVCEKITGYKPEDFINNKKLAFFDIIHPDYKESLYQKWEQTLKINKSFEHEFQIITASGELRWVWEQGIGVRDENGKITHFEGFILDVTDRKKAQEELKVNEEKFRTLFSEMNDLAVFCSSEDSQDGSSLNYKITDCNEAFLNAFNLKLHDVIDQSLLKLMGMDNLSFQEKLIDAVQHKRTYSFTSDFIAIDKKFQVTVVSLRQGNFAIIANDITELVRFNNILMEKNNELEDYVYVTSHDLRSPLVNIQGFSARLKKQTVLIGEMVESCDFESEKKAIVKESIEQKIPNALDYIFNNVNKMEQMLNGLLQLSRTGRVTMNISQVSMRDLIVKVIQSVDHQLHEISSEIVIGDLPNCYGDENMLNQLFSNLISNAIKYRHPKRKLKITIDGVMRFRKVQFRLQDNGIGIANIYLNKIWQVFFRVDSKRLPGDGVGLSVVKRIIEKHKGKIWIESTEQVGSTFFIELPAEAFNEKIGTGINN